MSETDTRDERLGLLLEDAVADLRPVPRPEGVLRSGARRRGVRSAAVLSGVAVFVGVVAWAAIVVRDRSEPPSAGPRVRYGSLTANGWTMSYPQGWHITPVSDCGINDYHGGFIVSNTDFTFRDPQGRPPGCEDRLLLGGFPSDGVALFLVPTGVRWGLFPTPRNTLFPMSLEDRRASLAWPGGPAESYEVITIDDHQPAVLRAYVGADASPADHDALSDIVWSLRYRHADLSMRFAPAEGWQTWTHVHIPGHQEPSTASASNGAVPTGTGRPSSLFGSGLPHDGIQITAWGVFEDRPNTTNANFPPGELPLQVPEQLETHWEGYPDPTGALRRGSIWVRVNGRYLHVWVLFGSDPSQQMRDAAQAELNRLFVPPAKSGAGSP